MSIGYWQAKIWGILHDPIFKALHNNQSGRGENSFWQSLTAMSEWVEEGHNPEKSSKKILSHIHLADYISSASDRGAIGSVTSAVNYNEDGLEITHLLSGAKLKLKLSAKNHQKIIKNRRNYLQELEQELFKQVPPELNQKNQEINVNNLRRLFWWLWRCLPEKVTELSQDPSLLLMPAETRLPDSSIWSHASITSALAGALAGYDLTTEQIKQKWPNNKELSHPYLVTFTFSPIQELIKASRKIRDFWAGSWILHYLSAKVCWSLAWKYGPDCFIYPNLYGQPLIDHWIRRDFDQDWVKQPQQRALLTAGFPNVLVLVLPKEKVTAAMQQAKSTLIEEWKQIAHLVYTELHNHRNWLPKLTEDSHTWLGWLNSQWQTYWTGIPIGSEDVELKSGSISQKQTEVEQWINRENQAYGLANSNKALFLPKEANFINKAAARRFLSQQRHFSVNVGSWWAPIFDQTRQALTTVKNARTWEIPTVFGPRSTISGIGSVVNPCNGHGDWISEQQSRDNWQRDKGLFDGIEQLNATETVKRGLEKILPELLGLDNQDNFNFAYPDLTSGVAGYLRVTGEEAERHFQITCANILEQFPQVNAPIQSMRGKWGIPYRDNQPQKYHPRLLNAGWLVEDADYSDIHSKNQLRNSLQKQINRYYPDNNPSNWYVLAAGDGDSMSKWLKGEKMQSYGEYIPSTLQVSSELAAEFQEFQNITKRMGPSTHNALSRALLDFSNQLAPYLTETRYTGRLIYSGGDDILAYTNLWEWDRWLWDIRQCFRGEEDTEFDNTGDYWQWRDQNTHPDTLAKRPLFTMGKQATISFGIIIAHHSVPLAISLENLWEAEAGAKDYSTIQEEEKDAVQVRVIYGNGNILTATTKFSVFNAWQQLLNQDLESSIFEQAAWFWQEHPIPSAAAISPWVNAFQERRKYLNDSQKQQLTNQLTNFLQRIWLVTPKEDLNKTVKAWLKLTAFTLRNRKIKLGV